ALGSGGHAAPVVARDVSHSRERTRRTSGVSHLEVWPSRAQFRPGEPVALRIAAEGTPGAIAVRARCREGSRVVADVECEVALDSSGRGELVLDGTGSAFERAGRAIEVLAPRAGATPA